MISEIGGDRTVYPIHSFDPAGTCFYHLLAVEQTFVPPNIEISFRTFRFATNDNQPQKQAVRCQLHLDPVTSVSSPQTPKQCSCFSPCECGVLPGYVFDTALSSCIDINECDNSPCPLNSDCLNTEGSYECLPEEGSGSQDEKSDFDCPNGVTPTPIIKDSWHPFKQFPKDYNHQLIFDNLDQGSKSR